MYTHTLCAESFQINEDIVWAQWDTEHSWTLCSFSSTSCNCRGLVYSPSSSKGVN